MKNYEAKNKPLESTDGILSTVYYKECPQLTSQLNNRILQEYYQHVRRCTEQLCAPLVEEDYVIQSMPDASPTKWHLAHVTWFWETFLLSNAVPNYKSFHPNYAYLFNSYYNTLGQRHLRSKRGLLSRPTVKETYEYRHAVDEQVLVLLENLDDQQIKELSPTILLGLNHEQQHQELILTDIKHVLSGNPLYPAYKERSKHQSTITMPLEWLTFPENIYWLGHEGENFAFDNESPRYRQLVQSFQLASRLITNGEYLAFIEDGGYTNPLLWLSEGWATVQREGWQAPLYWEKRSGHWQMMTLNGLNRVDTAEPVCHVSYFEADAFARWAGARLPTESEWEIAAQDVTIKGNMLEDGLFHPAPLQSSHEHGKLAQMYGDVWEWTQSSYTPYPGFKPAESAVGEYNGKFMCNQYVLRGGSCVTSLSHIRSTYRNFFPANTRWQFMGIRLAKDL